MVKEIGFVSSTVGNPANENRFQFIIKKNGAKNVFKLNQFDLIRVREKEDALFAIVESVSSFCDAPDHVANYVSGNFGQKQGSDIERICFYCVTARVLLNDKGLPFPVKTGESVYTCTKEEVYTALYSGYNEKSRKKNPYFPIAQQVMYKGNGNKNELKLRVYLNRDYLLGKDAAHLNISGMSGVASKTTKAMIILRELYYCTDNLSIIIFNTKQKDLLNIEEDDSVINKEKAIYSVIGNHKQQLWSHNIHYLYPFNNQLAVGNNNSSTYVLDFDTQKKQGNLDLLVAMDDESGTMDSCIKAIQSNKAFDSWASLSIVKKKNEKVSEEDKKYVIESLQNSSIDKFKRVVDRVIPKDDEGQTTGIFSTNSNINDISTILKTLLGQNNIIVVDISPLDPLQQAVVFGCVLRSVHTYKKENKNQGSKRIALFIDEINKYASYDTPNQAPILQNLIEIAETGRSNGICMITAEQSLSIIHRRIKANFANMIYGKTGPLELSQPDYMMIPDSYKQRITSFQHKDALVSTSNLNAGLIHAEFPDKFYKEQ